MKPLISVIVPCYNQAQYLDECLQSVLDQTFQDWECIIVNDGSPDHTEEVAKKWVEKDSRFKYLDKENGGLSSARNAGIAEAKGEWILPLDADDYIASNYLYDAHIHFENDDLKVIYGRAEKFGALNEPWDLKPFNLHNLAQQNVIYCSALYRKKDWVEIGRYDEQMKSGLEDWEFWIRMLKDRGRALCLPEVCFYYRIKDTSMLTGLLSMNLQKQAVFKYVEKKHYDFFSEQLGTITQLYDEAKKYEGILNGKSLRYFYKATLLMRQLPKKIIDFRKNS